MEWPSGSSQSLPLCEPAPIPPPPSTVGNKYLNPQSREIIAKVLNYMRLESVEKGVIIGVSHPRERTSAATGVSVRTVDRIVKERANPESALHAARLFTPQGKRRRRKNKPITGLDEFAKGTVRRAVYHFQLKERLMPTISRLKARLKDEINFRGSDRSMRKVLGDIGFRWRTVNGHRNTLVESTEIRAARIHYLRAIRRYREAGRPIVYMSETYILASDTTAKVPKVVVNNGPNRQSVVPLANVGRLIVLHAGGAQGFIPDCLALWEAAQSTGPDDQMNSKNFMVWIRDQLLPNMPKSAVLVLEDAPHHNEPTETVPTASSRRQDLKDWLTRSLVPFADDMLTPELYSLVELHRPQRPVYVLDQLMASHGHAVLRLPPGHADLSPIELIWAEVKAFVRGNNSTSKIYDVIKHCERGLQAIGPKEWLAKCRYAEEAGDAYMDLEPEIDDYIDGLVATGSVPGDGGASETEFDSSVGLSDDESPSD